MFGLENRVPRRGRIGPCNDTNGSDIDVNVIVGVVLRKGGNVMDAKNLAVLKNEIFSRVRTILYERYGEFVPASLAESDSQKEAVAKTIEQFESFKADEDLLDLFEALQKAFTGNYGRCLFCRNEIEFSKLQKNPLAKFCDGCESVLNLSYHSGESEVANH